MPYAHVFSYFASHIEAIITHGGYVILFIFTTLEGIPLVGMAVPGHIAIVVAGFFARIGTLDLTIVIIISVIGAILGDYIGFTLGRKYGLSFIDKIRPYFFVRDSHIEKTRNLLARHTGKAMIIGRFSPVTRALMPFLVGTTHTSSRKFWFYNIIGGISWAVISIFVGYVFGAGYHAAAGTLGKFVVAALIFAIITIWGYRFINMRFHIFKKYELFTLGLNVISLYVLARTIQDAWAAHSFMANFDIWVDGAMDMLHQTTPLYSTIAGWVSTIGGTAVTGGLGILIGIGLAVKKKWRRAAIMIMAIGSTGIATLLMKEFFLRARPENALQLIINDPSFPSGHASMSAAFFVVIAYFLASRIHSWAKRELVLVVCVLAVIAIGVSRLVLNVHWASDVIAGWALGTFLATASILLVRYVGALVVKKGDGGATRAGVRFDNQK